MIINLHYLYSIGGAVIGVIMLITVIALVLYVAKKGANNGEG